MPKVLIVDDHAQVRAGLGALLLEADASFVVGQAARGTEALALCRSETWDVVLLDLSMPGIDGQAVLRSLQAECPAMPVIILSLFIEPHIVHNCLNAGAMGYIAKEEIIDHAIPAIKAVLAGQRFLSPVVQDVAPF
jgi:DNA-binding NarL/FixJ family response regulator